MLHFHGVSLVGNLLYMQNTNWYMVRHVLDMILLKTSVQTSQDAAILKLSPF